MEKIFNEEKQKQLQNIKAEILRCLEEMQVSVKSIILFGSRAREDFNKESDFDLLIILNKDILPKEKKEIWRLVYKTLRNHYPTIPFDIIVKSAKSFEQEKDVVNTISNEVYLEGIEI